MFNEMFGKNNLISIKSAMLPVPAGQQNGPVTIQDQTKYNVVGLMDNHGHLINPELRNSLAENLPQLQQGVALYQVTGVTDPIKANSFRNIPNMYTVKVYEDTYSARNPVQAIIVRDGSKQDKAIQEANDGLLNEDIIRGLQDNISNPDDIFNSLSSVGTIELNNTPHTTDITLDELPVQVKSELHLTNTKLSVTPELASEIVGDIRILPADKAINYEILKDGREFDFGKANIKVDEDIYEDFSPEEIGSSVYDEQELAKEYIRNSEKPLELVKARDGYFGNIDIHGTKYAIFIPNKGNIEGAISGYDAGRTIDKYNPNLSIYKVNGLLKNSNTFDRIISNFNSPTFVKDAQAYLSTGKIAYLQKTFKTDKEVTIAKRLITKFDKDIKAIKMQDVNVAVGSKTDKPIIEENIATQEFALKTNKLRNKMVKAINQTKAFDEDKVKNSFDRTYKSSQIAKLKDVSTLEELYDIIQEGRKADLATFAKKYDLPVEPLADIYESDDKANKLSVALADAMANNKEFFLPKLIDDINNIKDKEHKETIPQYEQKEIKFGEGGRAIAPLKDAWYKKTGTKKYVYGKTENYKDGRPFVTYGTHYNMSQERPLNDLEIYLDKNGLPESGFKTVLNKDGTPKVTKYSKTTLYTDIENNSNLADSFKIEPISDKGKLTQMSNIRVGRKDNTLRYAESTDITPENADDIIKQHREIYEDGNSDSSGTTEGYSANYEEAKDRESLRIERAIDASIADTAAQARAKTREELSLAVQKANFIKSDLYKGLRRMGARADFLQDPSLVLLKMSGTDSSLLNDQLLMRTMPGRGRYFFQFAPGGQVTKKMLPKDVEHTAYSLLIKTDDKGGIVKAYYVVGSKNTAYFAPINPALLSKKLRKLNSEGLATFKAIQAPSSTNPRVLRDNEVNLLLNKTMSTKGNINEQMADMGAAPKTQTKQAKVDDVDSSKLSKVAFLKAILGATAVATTALGISAYTYMKLREKDAELKKQGMPWNQRVDALRNEYEDNIKPTNRAVIDPANNALSMTKYGSFNITPKATLTQRRLFS